MFAQAQEANTQNQRLIPAPALRFIIYILRPTGGRNLCCGELTLFHVLRF
jgi:hypothetical protein